MPPRVACPASRLPWASLGSRHTTAPSIASAFSQCLSTLWPTPTSGFAPTWLCLTNLVPDCTRKDVVDGLCAIAPVGRIMAMTLEAPVPRHPDHAIANVQFRTPDEARGILTKHLKGEFLIKGQPPYLRLKTRVGPGLDRFLPDMDGPDFRGRPPSRVLCTCGPSDDPLMSEQAMRELFVAKGVDDETQCVRTLRYDAAFGSRTELMWYFCSWRYQALPAMQVLLVQGYVGVWYDLDPCEFDPEELLRFNSERANALKKPHDKARALRAVEDGKRKAGVPSDEREKPGDATLAPEADSSHAYELVDRAIHGFLAAPHSSEETALETAIAGLGKLEVDSQPASASAEAALELAISRLEGPVLNASTIPAPHDAHTAAPDRAIASLGGPASNSHTVPAPYNVDEAALERAIASLGGLGTNSRGRTALAFAEDAGQEPFD